MTVEGREQRTLRWFNSPPRSEYAAFFVGGNPMSESTIKRVWIQTGKQPGKLVTDRESVSRLARRFKQSVSYRPEYQAFVNDDAKLGSIMFFVDVL